MNRILKPGGHLVLTTPNIAALRGIAAILQGYHPGFFHAYIRPCDGGEVDARHNREYTPREMHQLLENAGFTVTLLETGPFRETPRPEYGWVLQLLERYELPNDLRGDGIYAVGRKTGAVRERYPAWLYHHERRLRPIWSSPGARVQPASISEYVHRGLARRSEGFAVGYHVFDADTGTLIVDGARELRVRRRARRVRARRICAFALPEEAGRYRVVDLSHAGGRVLVLRARLAFLRVRCGGGGWRGTRLEHASA